MKTFISLEYIIFEEGRHTLYSVVVISGQLNANRITKMRQGRLSPYVLLTTMTTCGLF